MLKRALTYLVILICGTTFLGCAPIYLSREQPEGELLIRIALQRHQPKAVIYGSYSISASDKAHNSTILPGESWSVLLSGSGMKAETSRGTSIKGIEEGMRLWSADEYFINEHRVKGAIEIRPEKEEGLIIIAEMPLEEYLPGVLASEMGGLADKASEAAKAQAIISRSYAFSKIGTHFERFYDIEAGTAHQCFDLDNMISSAIKRAVNDTKGKVLTYQGRVISPNFHSTCGGRTAFPSEAWDTDDRNFTYLQSVNDRWCNISPRYAWSDTITADSILANLYPGKNPALKDVGILKKGRSGRNILLLISTNQGDTVLTKSAIRNGMKNKMLLSTWFDITTQKDEAGNISKVVLSGKGYGHGVGLCQWGAIGMARAGKGYKSILHHYYKGVKIEGIY